MPNLFELLYNAGKGRGGVMLNLFELMYNASVSQESSG